MERKGKWGESGQHNPALSLLSPTSPDHSTPRRGWPGLGLPSVVVPEQLAGRFTTQTVPNASGFLTVNPCEGRDFQEAGLAVGSPSATGGFTSHPRATLFRGPTEQPMAGGVDGALPANPID